MTVKKNIFIITVFAIIILGLAIYPVLANDAAEEKARNSRGGSWSNGWNNWESSRKCALILKMYL